METGISYFDEASLDSFFKSPIKSQDKEQYNTVLFAVFSAMTILIIELKSIINDREELARTVNKWTNSSFIEAKSIVRDLNNQCVKSGASDNIKIFVCLKIILREDKSFKNLPKSGFFCTREEVGKNWLDFVLKNVAHHADTNGKEYITSWFELLSSYLIKHHNNIFVVHEGESDTDARFRILNEFDAIGRVCLKKMS